MLILTILCWFIRFLQKKKIKAKFCAPSKLSFEFIVAFPNLYDFNLVQKKHIFNSNQLISIAGPKTAKITHGVKWWIEPSVRKPNSSILVVNNNKFHRYSHSSTFNYWLCSRYQALGYHKTLIFFKWMASKYLFHSQVPSQMSNWPKEQSDWIHWPWSQSWTYCKGEIKNF